MIMKARYLIYLLSGLMTFYSCVDDKGSYDYLQTPTVKITFSESIYFVRVLKHHSPQCQSQAGLLLYPTMPFSSTKNTQFLPKHLSEKPSHSPIHTNPVQDEDGSYMSVPVVG